MPSFHKYSHLKKVVREAAANNQWMKDLSAKQRTVDKEMMDYDPRTGVFRSGAEVRIKKTLEYAFRKLEIEKALKTNVLREALEHMREWKIHVPRHF